jgi:general secretion pathway protein K
VTAAGRRERGFAMIAAVAVMGIIADAAIQALATGRAELAGATAELRRAQLDADAQAAVAIAVHQLALSDPASRWAADGRTRALGFGADTVLVDPEDEGGKLPLNFMTPPEILRLFQLAGADPGQAQALTDELIRMRDGAPGSDPRSHGPLSALDELGLLPDMTPDVFARVAPAVTLAPPSLSFDPRVASPLALQVMQPSTPVGSGSAAAGGPAPLAKLVGLRIEARGPGGTDKLIRTETVELTSSPSRPAVARMFD